MQDDHEAQKLWWTEFANTNPEFAKTHPEFAVCPSEDVLTCAATTASPAARCRKLDSYVSGFYFLATATFFSWLWLIVFLVGRRLGRTRLAERIIVAGDDLMSVASLGVAVCLWLRPQTFEFARKDC